LSSFVGREQEITEVRRLLVEEDKNRLLTLTGPGGGGKTRLALAVASKVAERFEEGGGVWWVGLASLSEPDLVPWAIASTLGVRESPGRSLTEMLVEHLGSRKNTLLVLDNCEHLVDACAALADTLLHACPNLQILATSREALGIVGERAWLVPSLSLPDTGRLLPPLEELRRYEAVRLFLERAVAVAGRFELTEQNKSAVVRLCERLEGMPLAIELAAARARVLSVEQIASRLKDSFKLLATESRTARARQQTLRATIDWSYELLSEREKLLFRRLAVFAGGWTIEAAEEVCAAGAEVEGADEVLDLLTHLVDKSLVLVADQHQQQVGEARYRLLETVRQYGREKLEESGEEDEFGQRHANFFLRLAEEAEPHLKGHRQVAWLESLEREHDNLRAAMRFLLDTAKTAEAAVRLAWALWLFWYLHGHQGEGYRYAGELLDKTDALPTDMRARALIVRGNMSYGQESPQGTKQLFEEAAALSRQTGNRVDLAIALAGLGVTAMQQGGMQRATALFEEVLKLYREVENKWGVSYALVHLGMAPLSKGDHAGATRYFEEALAISREIGYRLTGYISLYSLALSYRVRGDHERAAELYREGLELALEAGDKANAAYCLEGLAGLIAARDEPERATQLFGASEALLEAVGAPLYAHAQDRALYESAVEALRSQLDEEAFGAAWSEGRAMALDRAVEYALELPPPAEEPAAPTAHLAGLLSAREAEVLGLVAGGLTNAQVAEELYISPNTVNRHLNSIYGKLGVGSRAAATRFAVEHDLL
jgi:non-specific serine/threonine protein kinase